MRIFYINIRCMLFESDIKQQELTQSMWDYFETMLRAFHIKTDTAAINELLTDNDAKRFLSRCRMDERSNRLHYRVPTKSTENGGKL